MAYDNAVDVVLVDCAFISQKKIAEPLGISYLAAALREKGMSVILIEPAIEGWGIEETVKEILRNQCKLIGLSAIRDENVKDIVSILEQVGDIDAKIFVGGHGPTIGVVSQQDLYVDLAKKIDGYSIGEGEIGFVELAMRVVSNEEWKDVVGVAYSDLNGRLIINNLPPKIADINTIPFMARDVLGKYVEKYGTNIQASVLSSRGCSYAHCTYCSVGKYERLQKGECSRYRSVLNIVEEIAYLHKEFGISHFNFEDDNFLMYGEEGEKRVIEFCERIKKLDFAIEFTIYCRADMVYQERFERMKSVGLRAVFLGVESFCDETLKFFNKGLKGQDMIRALDVLNNLGFSTEPGSEYRIHMGFIFWQPTITLNEIRITLDNIKKYRMTPKLLTRKLIVYRGCPMEKQLIDMNLLNTEEFTWNYVDSNMSMLEKYICKFINDICGEWDKIRTIEKVSVQFYDGKDYDEKIILDRIKDYLENACFGYVEKIIDYVEKHDNDLEIFLKENDNQYRKMVKDYLSSNKFDDVLCVVRQKFKIHDNETDLFRK